MRITYRHGTSKEAARAKLEMAIGKALEVGGSRIKDVTYGWKGDKLDFSFVAMAKSVRGTAEVSDTEIVVDASLPLMFRPFEGRAKSRILGELDAMFRR